jgi:hypothetical protein
MPSTAPLLALKVDLAALADTVVPAFAVNAKIRGWPAVPIEAETLLPPAEIEPTGVSRIVADPESPEVPAFTTRS